jgi:hypothetical protein
MTAYLAPIFGAGTQLFDNNGALLSGGKIYTYQAGSAVLYETWTTIGQTILNANPIILDSSGRVPNEIWLDSGISYKFILQDSLSNIIGTWDNLQGVNDFTWSNYTPVYSQHITMVSNAATLSLSNISNNYVDVSGVLTANGQITTTFPTNATQVTFDNSTTGAFLLQINAGTYTLPPGKSQWQWNGSAFEIIAWPAGITTVASAAAPNIFGTNAATVTIDNSTPVTTTSFAACQQAQVGTVIRLRPNANWTVTASANLKIDGVTAGNIVFTSNAKIDVLATSTTTFDVTTVYDSGTWTPNQGAGLTVVGAFASSGSWSVSNGIKTVTGFINPATSVATTAGTVICTNLPFTLTAQSQIGSIINGNITVGGTVAAAGATTTLYAATTLAASLSINFTVTYK